MRDTAASQSDAPQISVTSIALRAEKNAGIWVTRWRGRNDGENPLLLLGVYFPHSQFKSEERRFDPPIALGPGECAEFDAKVVCREAAGAIIENAFLIVSAVCLERPWRIFVRFRVIVNSLGEPESSTQSITAQRVGFFNPMRAHA